MVRIKRGVEKKEKRLKGSSFQPGHIRRKWLGSSFSMAAHSLYMTTRPVGSVEHFLRKSLMVQLNWSLWANQKSKVFFLVS